MGGGIFRCCQHPYGFEEIDSDGEEDPYARDVLIIRNMMYSAPTVTTAITVSYPDGKVRAVVPETFQPDPVSIKDLVNAFKGRSKNLLKRFIQLGPDFPTYVPGKMIDGRVLYCMVDGDKSGGCVVVRTRSCLLIATYDSYPEASARIVEDTAQYMIENGI